MTSAKKVPFWPEKKRFVELKQVQQVLAERSDKEIKDPDRQRAFEKQRFEMFTRRLWHIANTKKSIYRFPIEIDNLTDESHIYGRPAHGSGACVNMVLAYKKLQRLFQKAGFKCEMTMTKTENAKRSHIGLVIHGVDKR